VTWIIENDQYTSPLELKNKSALDSQKEFQSTGCILLVTAGDSQDWPISADSSEYVSISALVVLSEIHWR
jgi:hypothetical protein